MCEDHYLPNEFNYIVYQASSGGLSCPDSDARMSYYGIGGLPTLQFDGYWQTVVGAGSSVVDGVYYRSIVDSHREVESPIAVVVADYSYEMGSAFVEVLVKAFADIDPANHVIRVAIVEDDLSYGSDIYQNVCRDVLRDEPLTVTTAGDEQTVTLDIPMSAEWNPDKLQLIAFVQNDSNKYIVNSGNSFVGEFAAVAGVDGARQVIADGAQVTFGTTNLINIGLGQDTFDVSVDTSNLPEGWDASLSHDGGTYDTFQVTLDPYGAASFNVVMDTGEVGSGRVVVDVFSQGAGEIIESLDFVALAGGTDVLVIADDDGAGHAYDAYAPAIDATGKTYAVWDRGLAAVDGADLLDYEAVLWTTGSKGDALPAEDRAAIDDYLAAGGNLVLAGEDILQTLYNQGGSARLWYQLKLRLNYGGGNSGDLNVTGVDGDPVGDGLGFTLTGGDPDMIALLSGQPVETSFTYGNAAVAGARTTYSDYKVLTLPFGLERVPDTADRDAIIAGTFGWFGIMGTTPVEDQLPGAGLALLQNAPNPFNPITKIAFRLEQAGSAQLAIYDTRGQLVRTLVSETLPAGSHEIIWDGKTGSGQQAASGTYFYQLNTEGQSLTRKMTLVK